MKTRSQSGCLRRLLLLPLDVYGMATLLVLLAQAFIGERWHVVAFFNTFADLFWLPALLLIPVALLVRSGRTLALVLPAALAFVVTYGDYFIPKAPLNVTSDQISLRLATFNLYDDGRDPTQILALIDEMGADVVALQELNAVTAAALETHFASRYPYQALHGNRRTFRGMGVISKYPIVADRYWHYAWMTRPLGHQRVELMIEGQKLTLYNLHPVNPGMKGRFFDPTFRRLEIANLLKDAQEEEGLFMMAGDFNLPPLSDDYHRITRTYGFADAYRARGWGLGHTFTHGFFPFLRLDYLFLRTGVDVAQIQVWPSSAGSDHRPVVATLTLQKES